MNLFSFYYFYGMKYLRFLFILLLSIPITETFSQVPHWSWAKSVEGNDFDYCYSVATDANGNIYITGEFANSTITFGDSVFTSIGSSSDLFIAKYDSSGDVLWARKVGGLGNEAGRSIIVDVNSNLFLTGYFYSPTLTFGNTTLINNGGAGICDVFVAKYDSEGNVLWAKSGDGNTSDWSYGATTDQFGNVCITGEFHSPSITFGNITLTNAGNGNIFVVKYDSLGILQWAKSAGGSYYDQGFAITSDEVGNVYVTGEFSSDSLLFGSDTLFNAGLADIFIAKYDQAGNILWVKSASGKFSDFAYGITYDSGNLFLTGFFDSPSLPFDTITLTNAGIRDVFVVKYDTSGNVIWAKSSGGNAEDWGYSISTDENSNVWVTGYFKSNMMTFDSNNTLANSGGKDVFISKYDSDGNIIWVNAVGSNDDDEGLAIASNKNGSIYVAGNFKSSTISFGTTTLTNNGSNDIFIGKLGNSTNTSINEFRINNSVTIFPNPANKTFTISTPRDARQVQIFNLNGQLLKSISIQAESTQEFSLTNDGIYLIRVIFDGYSVSKKILVNDKK